jgi:hypothetical protein
MMMMMRMIITMIIKESLRSPRVEKCEEGKRKYHKNNEDEWAAVIMRSKGGGREK